LSYNYVALSHCWGQQSGFELSTLPKTTKENLVFHKSKGLLEQDLTRTFRNAIDVTRKLDVQYLWIDSLCIIQDDAEDMETELSKMGSIYGNAYLVIAATLAKNGSVGLDRERPLSNIEIIDSHGQAVKAAVREKSHHDVWKKGEQFWIALDLPLLDRAWAFQEHWLARRVVHFTPVELVWECRTCIDCECGDLSNPRTSWREFGIGKNLKTEYGEITRWGSDMDRIKLWHDLCAQYSSRKITKMTDRLPALSSSAKAMDMPPFLGRYLAGIWECTLPNGLLWWSEYTNSKLYPSGSKTH
jgi:Heterokaryon incompatibility protein (HET)